MAIFALLTMWTVLRPMLRSCKEIGWNRKAYVLGREGVCSELESDLFLIDMAAEGRGVTILTRALRRKSPLEKTQMPFPDRAAWS